MEIFFTTTIPTLTSAYSKNLFNFSLKLLFYEYTFCQLHSLDLTALNEKGKTDSDGSIRFFLFDLKTTFYFCLRFSNGSCFIIYYSLIVSQKSSVSFLITHFQSQLFQWVRLSCYSPSVAIHGKQDNVLFFGSFIWTLL